jgi:adenylate kinase
VNTIRTAHACIEFSNPMPAVRDPGDLSSRESNMRLVLLGAPGSGKGTQAARLRDHYRVPHISTGELLRAAVAAGTPLGQQAKSIMESGGLVPDATVLAMLEERLLGSDTADGFILDGYPRNLAQASALDTLLQRLGQPVERAVQLDVDAELLVARLAGRAQAEGRADDTPEAVRNRLQVYEQQTAPVIEFYRHQNKLSAIDGMGSMEDVFDRIVEALSSRFA